MSPYEKTIFDQTIKGLTWKMLGTIAVSIISTGLTVVFFAFKMYSSVIDEIRSGKSETKVVNQRIDNVEKTQERHEQQIQFLITNQIKTK